MAKKTNEQESETPPVRGDKSWKDYILKHVDKEDFKDGHPSFDGLYKACLRVMGDITVYETQEVKSPSERERSAVVITKIVCEGFNGKTYTFSDIADCFDYAEGMHSNTPAPFNQHLSSSAATKSAGRAIRKLLCINTITAEELADDTKSLDIASSVQITAIENSCNKQNIDIDKFLAKYANVSNDQLKTLTRNLCSNLIDSLNSFENDSSSIPEEIKK